MANGFAALSLPKTLVEKLTRAKFVTPTPIQAAAIPEALRGHDLIGIAQTGTGKTFAFGLPIATNLSEGKIALILAPTRELAEQIETVLRSLNLRTALLIGGASMQKQLSQLRGRPQVVVATPGRLEDHIAQGYQGLRDVQFLVLDEADRMLDMGFAPAINRIITRIPAQRQTLMFSATMPNEIAVLAGKILNEPKRIEIRQVGTAAEGVEQELLVLPGDQKPEMLSKLLAQNKGSVLVFARTRHGARKLAKAIRLKGHTSAEIHSDRTLAQRRAALQSFKAGSSRVLVATDIAARGIDVKDIELVINYDVPENPADYVHRIGRTGRAGATGRAIMLATPEQRQDVRDIERLMKVQIPVSTQSTDRLVDPAPTTRRSVLEQVRRPKTGQRRRFGR